MSSRKGKGISSSSKGKDISQFPQKFIQDGIVFANRHTAWMWNLGLNNRAINPEREVDLEDIDDTGVNNFLGDRGWENLFTSLGEVYPFHVRQFFANMAHSNLADRSFFTLVDDIEIEVTPKVVSDILGIPLVQGAQGNLIKLKLESLG